TMLRESSASFSPNRRQAPQRARARERAKRFRRYFLEADEYQPALVHIRVARRWLQTARNPLHRRDISRAVRVVRIWLGYRARLPQIPTRAGALKQASPSSLS